MNNNYNSNTVVKQDFAVVKQVDGRAAHMTDTTQHQTWQSTPPPPTRSCWIHPWLHNLSLLFLAVMNMIRWVSQCFYHATLQMLTIIRKLNPLSCIVPPNAPCFIILLCPTPDDFTSQGRALALNGLNYVSQFYLFTNKRPLCIMKIINFSL